MLNIGFAILFILTGLAFLTAGLTSVGAWNINRKHPPAGQFVTVNQTRMHFVHIAPDSGADLPAIVFIHGASGNLHDQMAPVAPLLKGRAELLFVDRPGHGWSKRGPATNGSPDGQADTIAALMDHLGIKKALVVGHSFGGAIAATFAVRHRSKTAGLLFLAAATHPWPGGHTSWYYELASRPVAGRIFSSTLAWIGGRLRMKAGTRCVFAPNRVPEDYTKRAAIPLVLRPDNFRHNAQDVAGLYGFVQKNANTYKSITAPTIVISGDRDTVVYEEIHSVGLARDIAGAELIWVKNLGHKPDWIATDLVIAAIEKLAGKPVDLKKVTAVVEARIAGNAYGPIERCPDEKPDMPQLEPTN